MVYVVVGAVVVFLTCFALVGVLAWKTYQRVRSLGRTVAAASTRIAEASAALDAIKPATAPYTRERRISAPEDGV
ncbi:MAG TPA: hypothetical protein VF519_10235 [Mycobacteriales bacterium]